MTKAGSFPLNVNIHDAKTNLSRYLNRVRAGETVVLCKNGEPVAQIIPFPKKGGSWQYAGIARHLIGELRDDFDEELTEKELPGFGLAKRGGRRR